MDLPTLSGLLFGFEQFFAERPRSQTNEMDFRPRIIPLDLATAIQALPDAKEVYHIILYSDRAEVWLRQQWLTSCSYHASLRGTAADYFKSRALHFSLYDSVKQRMGISDPNVLATVVAAIETDQLSPQLVDIFKLGDVISQYKQHKTK